MSGKEKTMYKFALCAGLLLVASTAMAAEIPYSSFSGTVINFDNLAGAPGLGSGEILSNQYAGQGVTFNVPNFNAYATNGVIATSSALNSDPNVIWVDQGGGLGGPLAVGMNINFSSPQTHVGMLFLGSSTGTFSIAAYNGNTLLETVTHGLPAGGVGQEGFMALQNTNITRAVVYATNTGGQNWNFSIDDLKYLPEPGTAGLLGLIGLAALRRRR